MKWENLRKSIATFDEKDGKDQEFEFLKQLEARASLRKEQKREITETEDKENLKRLLERDLKVYEKQIQDETELLCRYSLLLNVQVND